MRTRLLLALSTLAAMAACFGEPTVPGCQQVPTLVTSTRGDTLVTVTGLKYLELQAGAGATAQSCQSMVTVRYVGMFLNGEVFDPGNQPLTFLPGAGQLIPGFEQGVVGMKVGGKRRLILSPELGYRDGQTRVFDVELTEAS